MGIVRWLLLAGAVAALLAGCGGRDLSEGSADCGSVLRYHEALYWGTGASAAVGRDLGRGEEPRCADIGADAVGPTSGAVGTNIPVAAVPGVDPTIAVVVVVDGSEQGEVYVQGSGPDIGVPPAVRKAIETAQQ